MTDIGRGYIHVYTGNGKGKTTSSLGLALRAVGRGLKVLVIQFLKGEGEDTGERLAAARLAPEMEMRQRGPDFFLEPGNIPDEEMKRAAAALAEAKSELVSGKWDLVVLDEANTAAHFGLFPEEDLFALMDSKPDGVELVLTGRYASEKLIGKADLITEMREIKHYYNDGVPARRGIEK
jgi:cob(I)alamin adenosyltransferase